MPKTFQHVTGVSTGSLMAPFVFLARESDGKYLKQLGDVYKSMSSKKLIPARPWLSVPFSDSLYRNDRLLKIIQKYVDTDMLHAIAKQAELGRRLWVGTVNLDTGRTQIHDMTALAAKGDLARFQDTLLASAAVPLIFPPVFMDKHMHVDGGTREIFILRQFMLHEKEAYRQWFEAEAKSGRTAPTPTLYVLVNQKLILDPECVKDGLLQIGKRSVNALMNSDTLGNLYYAYLLSLGFGDFRMAMIPWWVQEPSLTTFTEKDMVQLFEQGKLLGANPHAWMDHPPLLDELDPKVFQSLTAK